jgi:ribosomal protein L37AE/L43A
MSEKCGKCRRTATRMVTGIWFCTLHSNLLIKSLRIKRALSKKEIRNAKVA